VVRAFDVSSAPGAGTTFSIRLPATRRPHEPEAPQEPPATGGSEHVLLVED